MTERHQFVRLFDQPHKFQTSTFQAYWKDAELKRARLGITIKGRLSSVWRMRVKRIVREWFRVSKESLGPQDLNIVVRIPAEMSWDFVDRLKTQLKKWKS